MTDVPFCLKRAREEMLKALGAEDSQSEGRHRRRADRYVTEAIHGIDSEPDRKYDWSVLAET